MGFNWSLSVTKSLQVSWTLLSILADLNKVLMVSTRPLISMSSSPFKDLSVTVPRAPLTIDITVTFMFHSFFFYSLARSKYLSFFSLSFNFTLWSAGTAKSTIWQGGFKYHYLWLDRGLNPGFPDHWRTLYSAKLICFIVHFRNWRTQKAGIWKMFTC